MLNTAVDGEILRRNPCRITGAGQSETPERPTATLTEVFAIATGVQRRYRLLVLLAAFGQLRFGELVALRRSDLTVPPMREPTATEIVAGADPDSPIDDGVPVLRVSRALAELNSGQRTLKGPKSAAGRRTVALPAAILPEIREHLRLYAETGSDGRLFIGPKGASPLAARSTGSGRRQCGRREPIRCCTCAICGTPAALIYQHATSDRDQRIAHALDAMIKEAKILVQSAIE